MVSSPEFWFFFFLLNENQLIQLDFEKKKRDTPLTYSRQVAKFHSGS